MASVISKKQKKKKKEKYSLSELKTLGHQLLSSRAHINNLPLLLDLVSPSSPPQFVLESLVSLQSFFTPLLPQLPPSSSSSVTPNQNDPDVIYRTWLRAKFDDFVRSLIEIALLSHSEHPLREVALDTLMDFVKVGNAGRFHSAIYHKFLHSIVNSSLEAGDVLLDLLASKYFKYTDVCYFTYIVIEKLAGNLAAKDLSGKRGATVGADANIDTKDKSGTSMELSIHKLHYILSHIPPEKGMDEKSGSQMWNGLGIFVKAVSGKEHSVQKGEEKPPQVLSTVNVAKKVKLKFTKAWISFLRLPLPPFIYKEVLATVHQAVIPYLANPIMLCDFLTQSYDIGGVISVMALSGLFVLMTQHGLEYPNFYEKLYALLEPSIFMAKHRAKFFELLDSCLKSPLLPAYLAAAFTKKLSRLALSVPPSGAFVIISLIHNLLRRHPSINFLVHQEVADEATKYASNVEKEFDDSVEESCASSVKLSKNPGVDHFKNEESNPVKTNAMSSSLWEIDTLRHHYCPPVSRFVLSLENDLTVRAKTTEMAVRDFSSGSYATIFRDEIERRVKQVPLAFYKETPTCLFLESNFPGWCFQFKSENEPVVSNDEEHVNLNNNSAKRKRKDC